MYRERIIEAKAALGLSSKHMAELSKIHTTRETIQRFLSGETNDIHISTLMDLADIVGLAPHELFMEKATADEFRLYMESKVHNLDHIAELEALRIKTAEDDHKIEHLEIELAHARQLIKVYEHFVKIEDK